MAYRKRIIQSKKMENARVAKERKRLECDEPERKWIPPNLRRKIIIIDYDMGKPVVHKIDLYKSDRIDQYIVKVDDKLWKKAGWAKTLEGIRKSFLRVQSI